MADEIEEKEEQTPAEDEESGIDIGDVADVAADVVIGVVGAVIGALGDS